MKGETKIVIPVYKDKLTSEELMSLRQCLNVLSKYDKIFIGPVSLNVSMYKGLSKDKIGFELFPDFYFSSLNAYNRLLLSKHFYRRFLAYKYIFLYQLDALVFNDELEYWCDLGYDYIGAPQPDYEGMDILEKYKRFCKVMNRMGFQSFKVRKVGNGGLSLRKVKSHIRLLTVFSKQASRWHVNEDTFFTFFGNISQPFFKIPDEELAAKFSIETYPQYWFKRTGNQLPFGCHAWEKYDKDFWLKIFSERGLT